MEQANKKACMSWVTAELLRKEKTKWEYQKNKIGRASCRERV